MKTLFLGLKNLDLTNSLIRFSPWLTPLSAAQITIKNMIERLGYWEPIAWLTGFAIEILGIATLDTALTFWRHNRRYTADQNKLPTWIPVAAFCFYIIVVLLVVVALEWPVEEINKVYINVMIKALLATLSIPAGATIAVREIHKDTLQELAEKRAMRAVKPEKVTEKKPPAPEKVTETFPSWLKLPENLRKEVAKMETWEKVREKFPYLSERSAQNWLKYGKRDYPV